MCVDFFFFLKKAAGVSPAKQVGAKHASERRSSGKETQARPEVSRLVRNLLLNNVGNLLLRHNRQPPSVTTVSCIPGSDQQLSVTTDSMKPINHCQ